MIKINLPAWLDHAKLTSDTTEINLILKTLMSNPMLTSLWYKTENLFSY